MTEDVYVIKQYPYMGDVSHKYVGECLLCDYATPQYATEHGPMGPLTDHMGAKHPDIEEN